jgi:hypothetical protein
MRENTTGVLGDAVTIPTGPSRVGH